MMVYDGDAAYGLMSFAFSVIRFTFAFLLEDGFEVLSGLPFGGSVALSGFGV